jgi:uncharacterized protein
VAQINHDTAGFWLGWQRHELRIARCQGCGTWIHPPRRVCPHCWSDSVRAEVIDGAARLVTWSLPRASPGAGGTTITGVVAMDAAPDVRLLAQIVGCPVDRLEVGMALAVDWRGEDGTAPPRFRPAAGG